MERKPKSTGSIVGAVVLLVVVPLGLYFGGYFALGTRFVGDSSWLTRDFGKVLRVYRYSWLARAYQPLASVEAAVSGKKVRLYGGGSFFDSDGKSGMVGMW